MRLRQGATPAFLAFVLSSTAFPVLAADPVCGDVNANGSLTSSDALLVLRASVGQPVSLACPPRTSLRQTGQTECWQPDIIGFPVPTVPCPDTGQDGESLKGISISFVDNGDGTISDEATGLVWEKLDNDPTGMHYAKAPYSWPKAFGKISTLNESAFAGHTDWRLPNMRELASLQVLGASGSVIAPVFRQNCTPGCTIATCSCTDIFGHWSSTTLPAKTFLAWTVDFSDGGNNPNLKDSGGNVRAVRGGFPTVPAVPGPVCGDVNGNGALSTSDALLVLKASVGQPVDPKCPPPATLAVTGQNTCWELEYSDAPPAATSCAGTGQDGERQFGATRSYTDNGNGTITDHGTGLTWEKLDDANTGGIHDKDNTYLWFFALEKVFTLNESAFAGHTDWRLPNRKELESLLVYESADSTLDPVFDTACTLGCTTATCSCTLPAAYWSSSTSDRAPTEAWSVDFGDGSTLHDAKTTSNAVRAVRGGF